MLDILNTQIQIPTEWIGYALAIILGSGTILIGRLGIQCVLGWMIAYARNQGQKEAEEYIRMSRLETERNSLWKCSDNIWGELVDILKTINSHEYRAQTVEKFIEFYHLRLPVLTKDRLELIVDVCGNYGPHVRTCLLPLMLPSFRELGASNK